MMWRVTKSRSRSRPPSSSSSSCHPSDASCWRKRIPPYACGRTPLRGFSPSLWPCGLRNMEDLSTMTPTTMIGKIAAFEMSRKMCQGEKPTSSRPYAFACNERKGKKKAPNPSFSSEEEKEEENDDEEDNQPSTSSSEDEETIQHVGKVMRMIRKINLMGVPLQVEDLLFNIDRKKQRKRGCFACGEKGHFKDSCPTMAEPKKERSKGKALTSVKTWDDSSSEDEHPRTRNYQSSSRSSR
jgi:hypothetical protein